jgi:tricorn protease
LRDSFYDEHMNNLDWDAILRKYEDKAAHAPDQNRFQKVVSMLLGELNASHLDFVPAEKSQWSSGDWRIQTSHLGLRFDPAHTGPGLKVASVIRAGPSDQLPTRILPGETVLRIDDRDVTPDFDLTEVLNGVYPRDIRLEVQGTNGMARTVTLRHMSYTRARELIRDERIEHTRGIVDGLSSNTLGYLNIERMNWPEFHQFEKEIHAQGVGKQGLIIDVRENPGGFVSDHLLTILCHPRHAVTVPRDGEESYPGSYLVYTKWDKPIVVMCNQNSTSNAEIFCHAIKTLQRGKVVGVPTRGSVIATPRIKILDFGEFLVPERGFFTILDGKDMELNGVEPDFTVWPEPGEIPAGKDRQLEKAVEVLLAEIEKARATPRPQPVPASQRENVAGR